MGLVCGHEHGVAGLEGDIVEEVHAEAAHVIGVVLHHAQAQLVRLRQRRLVKASCKWIENPRSLSGFPRIKIYGSL